jgi:MraZ protein
VFYGEFDISIDPKNRIVIPAEVRREIVPKRDGEQFFIVVGTNRRAWLYPDLAYKSMVANELPTKLTPGREVLKFDSLNFALARKVEPDKQWRISIPPEMIRRTGMQKEITLVGVRTHLELWDRAQWKLYIDKLLDERAEESDSPPGT